MNKEFDLINQKANSDTLPGIKDCEALLLKVIRERLGIIINSHQKNELYKTILDACHKFSCTPQEYVKLISQAPDKSILLDHLVTGITIGETYFFRDKNQVKLLTETILPSVIKTKIAENNKTIRIWSAGCASGEEIYTIAIILSELIKDIEVWTIKLLATDINIESLQKGIVGGYSEWSMRSIASYHKDKYFTKTNNRYILSRKICEMVNFEFLNLNDDSYPSIFNGTNAQDLILCRNVLIYFDIKRINTLMKKFNKCILPGGYLMLGASDPVSMEDTDFQFEENKGLLFRRSGINVPIPVLQTQQKVHNPLEQPAKIVKKHVSKPITANLIADYFNQSKWTDLLNEISFLDPKKAASSDILSFKAIALANLGSLDEAVKICHQVFKMDPTNKLTYFTYALAQLELNHITEAETALRKTLFLDNKFVAGHYQLGLLLIKTKQLEPGLKYLRNALKIAESIDPKEIVPGSQKLDYEHLAEILRNEISLYV